ncbi:hypothetical protein DEU40_12249 [Chryseobacterium sp. AG844]|nr:hypothetical protein DEU40_12249 [Chryseobacterium sp. AG844]
MNVNRKLSLIKIIKITFLIAMLFWEFNRYFFTSWQNEWNNNILHLKSEIYTEKINKNRQF